jgi:hypothetical protein
MATKGQEREAGKNEHSQSQFRGRSIVQDRAFARGGAKTRCDARTTALPDALCNFSPHLGPHS